MEKRKYDGLADIALFTREMDIYGEENVQLNYDIKNDRVWVDKLQSLAKSSAVVYDDENIINCGIISHPSTKAEIRTQIEIHLKELGLA